MESNTETDSSTWNVLYPSYLDKDLTTTQGRRVSASVAVSNPTLEEMKLVLERLEVPYVLEPAKRYPRNWLVPGRVKVCLKDEKTAQRTRSKRQLLREMASLISQLKTRQQPKQVAKSEPSTSSGKKKPGKKKR